MRHKEQIFLDGWFFVYYHGSTWNGRKAMQTIERKGKAFDNQNPAVFFNAEASAELMAAYTLLPPNYCRHCGERLDLEPRITCLKRLGGPQQTLRRAAP